MTIRRIGVVAYHSSPLQEPGAGDSGGMTVYVRAVAAVLAEQGIATDIFTRATTDLGRAREVAPGVRVISIQAGPATEIPKEEQPRYLDDFVAGVRAFALMQRLRYDVVHSHYWQSGLAAEQLATSWGVPLIHSSHTLGRVKNLGLAPGDSPETDLRIQGEHRVMERAAVLVASTTEELEHLACLYRVDHDKLKMIPPGVDHDLFHPGDRSEARRRLGWGEDPVLLYAGRIQRLKGLDLAIDALAHLVPGRAAPPRLVIAGGASGRGGSEELERLQTMTEAGGLSHLVSFAGPQPQSKLADMYRAADVVLVCSHNESFGLVALEAQSCGTPVVATAVGAMSNIISDGCSGWLLYERDPEIFAKRIASLIDDEPLRAAFSQEAVRSSQRSSWEVTASELASLYECLVREQLPEACTC